MFYLTTHSTHFMYGYMASDMVKDRSDSEIAIGARITAMHHTSEITEEWRIIREPLLRK